MKEAKKRNPHIKIYGLAWTFPYHIKVVEDANRTITAYGSLVNYLLSWVQGAKRVHGLDVDYIGVWNEHGSSVDFIKAFRTALDNTSSASTKIIGTDWVSPARHASCPPHPHTHSSRQSTPNKQNVGHLKKDPIVKEIRTDPALREAVHAFGYHYPGTSAVEKGGPLYQDLPGKMLRSVLVLPCVLVLVLPSLLTSFPLLPP
jgi:hypothetical protein